MKYFIIAGEQSGDLHGSNLIKELVRQDNNAEIYCWGGDLMEKAGGKLLMHYKKNAFMGFTIILKNLGAIRKNLNICRQHILKLNPDRIILIDYAGFNLRIAKFSKKTGFPVFYYISPKFWAWNEKRVKKVKKYVDRMLLIFPFEEEFYRRWNIPSKYVGNPLSDEIEQRLPLLPEHEEIVRDLELDNRPVIALLAGSRRQEVKDILPIMLNIVHLFPDYQFILAGVENIGNKLYNEIIQSKPVKIVKGKTYELLSIATAALVTSGTATLETCLFKTPQIVCYKSDPISMFIGYLVIKVKYISLVNLIADKEVVSELIGSGLNKRNLFRELSSLLPEGIKRDTMIENYEKVRELIGKPGASKRAANEIIKGIH